MKAAYRLFWMTMAIFISVLFSCNSDNTYVFADFSMLQKGQNIQADSHTIHVLFDREEYVSIQPSMIGLPESWAAVKEVIFYTKRQQKAGVFIFEFYGKRSRIIDTLFLKAGRGVYSIDLREVRLIGGLNAEVLEIRIHAGAGVDDLVHADNSKDNFVEQPVERLQNHRTELHIGQFKLLLSDQKYTLVDRFGQRNLLDFPGKVFSESELRISTSELEFLDSISRHIPKDNYGGMLIPSLKFRATGFFRVEWKGGRWYLVTPEGHPFYSLGVNGVRRKSTLNNAALTRVAGRQDIFEDIPSYSDCRDCFREDSSYLSFYCVNCNIKYASPLEWKQHNVKRLDCIGFNTVGNWSDTLFRRGPLAYTVTLDSRVFTGLIAGGNLPDVFHPDWEKRIDCAFSSISRLAEDPFLLGYFVDNEIPWGRIDHLDSASFSFQALCNLPQEFHQELYAEKYFETISGIIKKYDPNHLYLGTRFTRNLEEKMNAATVAGKYVDVFSMNVYSMFTQEEMDAWHEAAGRPILISEHHVPPLTSRALLPRYPAFNPEERDSMLTHYLNTWISFPYAVGSHWYQYVDQEVAGRMDGGENQPVGLVSVTDQLDKRLAELFSAFESDLYEAYNNR